MRSSYQPITLLRATRDDLSYIMGVGLRECRGGLGRVYLIRARRPTHGRRLGCWAASEDYKIQVGRFTSTARNLNQGREVCASRASPMQRKLVVDWAE